jgi:hypothetical protein
MEMSLVCNNISEIAETIIVRCLDYFQLLDRKSGEGRTANPSEA